MQEINSASLLEIAAKWAPERIGNVRNPDGTLPEWYEWAASHPQRDEIVDICRGREEWEKARSSLLGRRNTLSVVSWNILSDHWYRRAKETGSTYDHTPLEFENWEKRFALLMEWVKQLHPDVLALQEVDYTKYHDDLVPSLEALGYRGLVQVAKKQSADQPCGVATFWDAQKFDLVDHSPFSRSLCAVLAHTKREHSLSEEHSLSDKQHVPEKFCLANVHLESSQAQTGFEHRARQLNSTLAYVSRVAPSSPLVVCGDCNTGADSPMFHVLRTHQWHGHNIASAYEHPSTSKTLPVNRATFAVPGHHYVIDHLLYSHNLLRLRSVLDALTPEEIEQSLGPHGDIDQGFPNHMCPSDHIPVGGIFEFVPAPLSSTVSETQPEVTPERKEELSKEWERWKSQQPPKVKGKPTPEQIAERKAHATAVKMWKKSLSDTAEIEFITSLEKKGKGKKIKEGSNK